jgi:hypothetical protein
MYLLFSFKVTTTSNNNIVLDKIQVIGFNKERLNSMIKEQIGDSCSYALQVLTP